MRQWRTNNPCLAALRNCPLRAILSQAQDEKSSRRLTYNKHMSYHPTHVAHLLSLVQISELARPSDIRYGRAIHDRGGVEYIENEPSRVEAWVGGLDGSVAEGGSQRRRTQLFTTKDGLQWHCAGNPKNHQIFCKHCVALALTILDNRK